MKHLQLTRKAALLAALTALVGIAPDAAHAQLKKKLTFTGIVAGPPANGEFRLRTSGQTYRVRKLSRPTLAKIRGGDLVRVYGVPLGLSISQASVRVLRSKASSSPDDYAPIGNATIR